jgi:glycosyltransferase involved in cell wall biosynthesis
MLETVISKEVQLMNYFDLTLFPTRQSKLVLEALDVHNGYFVGFTSPFEDHMKQGVSESRGRLGNKKIKFLHIGGHSPTIRKKSLTIIKEFLVALEKRKDISLTVSLQEVTEEFDTLLLPPEIEIIKKELTDSDIAQLYKDHDVSIQIPTHEGIGIGFYESISLGTPVITLNWEPHSEAISSGFSGWLLPATSFNLPDNSDGVVDAGNLEACSLANLLVNLNEQEIIEVRSRTHNFYLENYSNTIFRTQLLGGLGSKKIINPRARTSIIKLREVIYLKSFNIFAKFSKKYLVKIIPLSVSQKYRIKQFLRLIDQKISKFLK